MNSSPSATSSGSIPSQDQSAMLRVQRELRLTVACHQIVARAESEQELLDAICEVFVSQDHYLLAWIGRRIDDDVKTVLPVASRGLSTDYLESLPIHWGHDRYSNGPTGIAVRTGAPSVNQDVRNNPTYRPWREQAVKYGYESSAAIPCRGSEKTPELVLNLYASAPNAFDDDEVKLLEALAADIAFGTRHLRARRGRELAVDRLWETLTETVELIVSALEQRDPYTAAHQRRVAQLATSIAESLGWSESRIEVLRLGAMLHDVGKLAVPVSILTKPGSLSSLEFELIKTHTKVGAEIVSQVSFPWPIAEIVAQHHERLDGSGYPAGLVGPEIVSEARIVGVADVVEAMSSDRPYRASKRISEALSEIEEHSGVRYDAEVVEACARLFRDENFEWR